MTKQICAFLARKGYSIVQSPAGRGEQKGGDFFAWFRDSVLGIDSDEYRREFWREAAASGHTIGHVPRGLNDYIREHTVYRSEEFAFLLMLAGLMGACFVFWAIRFALRIHIGRLRRPMYYGKERERRRMLAAERRAIRTRRTVNGCPSLDDVRAAFAHRRDSAEAALRLGGLLQDLECYVDNRVLIDPETNEITGRRGGVKRLLQREAPELFARYKTLMRYKALAKKYRQACDAQDPVPVDALLPCFLRRSELECVSELSAWMAAHGNTTYLKGRDVLWYREPVWTERHLLREESRTFAREILAFQEGTLVSLEAAIALRIDPDCADESEDPDPRMRVHVPGSYRAPRRVRDWIHRAARRAA